MPLLTIVAFATMRQQSAVMAAMLGGILFLPELVNFDAPLIPPIGKNEMTALSILIGGILTSRGIFARAKIGRGIDLFLWATLVGQIVTVLTNSDATASGDATIQGLTTHDTIAWSVISVVNWMLPFIYGRAFFRTQADGEVLLRGLVIAAMIHVPFVLIELRLSPQLHRWVYGFAQHSFSQTVREGGWRPMCFMAHGLALALFYFTASTAGWTYLRAFQQKRPAWLKLAAISLLFVTAILHSFGALIFVLIAIPLVQFTKPVTQVRIGVLLVAVLCAYPILKENDLVPTQFLIDKTALYSQDRAQSLAYRLDNEQLYFNRAMERRWFGWGGYGRSRLENAGASDGAWVIELGVTGFFGYYARFGMMLASVLLALRRLKSLDLSQQRILGGLSLIVGLGAIDLIANGLWNILTIFYCGALTGLSQGMERDTNRNTFAQLVKRLLDALLTNRRNSSKHA
jgi:hypothetical protein